MAFIRAQLTTSLLLVGTLAFGSVAMATTDKETSLLNAAAAGDAEQVRQLLAAGVDADATGSDGTTALMNAIRKRHHGAMLALLDAGADIRRVNRYGIDAMYVASYNGDTDAVRALLQAGADPNAALPEGQTALMTAARAGNAEIIKMLLAAGADGYGVDPDAHEGWLGQTALMWAAAAGHVEAMHALIAGGANINEQSWLIANPNIDGGRSMGVSFSHIPKGRFTALHFASRQGQLAAVRTLVDAGADLNITDEYGTTALIVAAVNGHFDVAGALLEAGADPNVADEWGRTVIFTVTDIITRDAIARAQPRFDDTLTAADVVRLALAKGADPDALLTKKPPTWINVGGDHSPIVGKGASTLLRAAMSGDLPIIRLLLDAGADPTLATPLREGEGMGGGGGMGDYGHGGTTPFLAAAGVGWRQNVSRGRDADAIEALKIFMSLGADVNSTNQAGDTALHAATYRGSLAIMKFLLDAGADPTIVNRTGWTPMDIALGQPDPAYRIAANPEAQALLRSRMPAQ